MGWGGEYELYVEDTHEFGKVEFLLLYVVTVTRISAYFLQIWQLSAKIYTEVSGSCSSVRFPGGDSNHWPPQSVSQW